MNGKELLEAMSYVDVRLVDEAQTQFIGRTVQWKKWLSVAACLCLIFLSAYLLRPSADPGEIMEGDEPPQSAEGFMPPAMGMECPSLILRIDTVTDTGFVATVAELVDTEIIPVGTELTVVTEAVTEGSERALVMVQFTDYDPDTATIIASVITPVEEGKEVEP